MNYEYPEETKNFTQTFAEAMASHAYGDNLIAVRIDPVDICTALITVSSRPSCESAFDYLGYFVKSKEMFGEEGRTEVTGLLLDFMSNQGHI